MQGGQLNRSTTEIRTSRLDLPTYDINDKTWQSRPDSGEIIGQHEKEDTYNLLGAYSPQSNWAVYHTNNGHKSAELKHEGLFHGIDKDAARNLLEVLEDEFNEEKEIIK